MSGLLMFIFNAYLNVDFRKNTDYRHSFWKKDMMLVSYSKKKKPSGIPRKFTFVITIKEKNAGYKTCLEPPYIFFKKKTYSLPNTLFQKMSKRNNPVVVPPSSEKKRKAAQEQAPRASGSSVSHSQPSVEVSQFQKGFEKIMSQNQKILQKLDVLISSQKNLEERMKKLEQAPENSNDEELIKVMKLFHCKLFT